LNTVQTIRDSGHPSDHHPPPAAQPGVADPAAGAPGRGADGEFPALTCADTPARPADRPDHPAGGPAANPGWMWSGCGRPRFSATVCPGPDMSGNRTGWARPAPARRAASGRP